MLTNTALKTLITKNFADVRCTAILLFIRDLVERKKFGGGIEQYRLFNKTSGQYITSVTDFMASIDDTALTMSYFYNSDTMTGDRVHPFKVVLDNIEVRLNPNSADDDQFTMMVGMPNRIMFLMNYLSDADNDLPLKIFEVRLISEKTA
jgi:hypothetical protein